MKKKIFIIPMLALSLTVGGLTSCFDIGTQENTEQNENQDQNKNYTISIEPVKNITVNVDVNDKVVGDAALITLVFKQDATVEKVTVNDVEAIKLSKTSYKFNIVEGTNNIKVHIKEDITDPILETGTVTISPNALVAITPSKSSGNVGDVITLDVELLDTTYKVDSIKVNDVNAKKINDSTYEFTLSKGKNLVVAYLSKIENQPIIETGTITVSPNAFVTITPNKYSGNVGDVIKLNVQITDNNYVVDYIKVNKNKATKINNTQYEFRLEKGENVVTAYLSNASTEPENPGELLPNGYYKIAPPDNLNNPIDIAKKDFTTFDCSQEVPANWKYIYMNKSTAGEFYEAYGQHIALSFTDPGRGIQTPALVSATKYELRMTVSELHGTDASVGNSKKDTFLIYGYNDSSKLIYQQGYTPFKDGINKDRKDDFDIKIYLENPDVRYFEVRLNDRIYNDKANPKYVNFGINTLKLRAYNY